MSNLNSIAQGDKLSPLPQLQFLKILVSGGVIYFYEHWCTLMQLMKGKSYSRKLFDLFSQILPFVVMNNSCLRSYWVGTALNKACDFHSDGCLHPQIISLEDDSWHPQPSFHKKETKDEPQKDLTQLQSMKLTLLPCWWVLSM